MTRSPDMPPLEVYLLGLIDFEDAQRLQRRLAYDLGEGGGGALVLCEHPPTLTVGRSGSRAHIRPDDDELRELGIRVHWVNRGGGCLLHLPGQLVAYLSLPLDRLGLDLGGYLDGLRQATLGVLAEFDLGATARPELTGVYLGQARVAALGVAVNRWVTTHGLALNVGPYLEPFEFVLDEPGPDGHRLLQTSMEARRQRPAPMAKVREALVRQVEQTFGLRQHHVYTEHPLIRPETRRHALAQSFG